VSMADVPVSSIILHDNATARTADAVEDLLRRWRPLAVTSNRRTIRIVPGSPILVTLMM
jgi:hypothetical protein